MEKLLKYELIELLKKDVLVFNDYREKNNFERIDLSYANLSNANLYNADLSYANLSDADLDYASLSFSCKSIKAKFDEKHIIQILYHAAMPTQNNKLNIKDKDLKKLLKLTTFKKVVNKFHRIKETGKFIDFKEQ